jgi:hypothetical protein
MKNFLFYLLIVFSSVSFAQNVAINATGAAPVASAMLDITSTTSGLLIPRMSSVQRVAIATPATGLKVYDTTTNTFWYFNGVIWVQVLNANTGWALAGNTLAGTEILGSTNNQPVRMFSNNTERMRILATGQVAVNSTATFANSTFYSLATGNNNAVDGNAAGTGAAVYGQNTGTGQGVYGISSNATGLGLYGVNTNAAGTAIYGFNNAVAGAAVGFGGFFRSSQTGGACIVSNLASNSYFANTAVSAFVANTVAGGRAVIASCDNATGAGIQGQSSGSNATGVIGLNNGNRFGAGVFGGHTAGIAGTGFTIPTARGAVKGEGAVAGSYGFGVIGSGGSSTRSGGVLGDDFNFVRGALGYYASNGLDYGVYAFGNYNLGGNGGKMANSNNDNANILPNASIALGAYGGIMGGWIKGLVYGANFSGSKYGAYVHGKTITNDVIAVLNTNQGTQERTATYATTSMKVEVTDKGKNNLTQGRTVVIFDRQFSSLLSPNEEVIITVSPLGNSQGLYIENISTNGFTVVENNNGSSNVNFNWIAIGVKKGFEKPTISPEILANDFEEKINGNDGVMYNDMNPATPKYSIWWDGSAVRFDKPMLNINREEVLMKAEEAKVAEEKEFDATPKKIKNSDKSKSDGTDK